MNDEQARQLRRRMAAIEGDRVPGFDSVFAAAEDQVRTMRTRWRYVGGLVAAAIVVAVVAGLLPSTEPEWRYVDPDLLASTTSWEAPSDVLLPQRSVDIFDDIPVLIEGTRIDEGALL